MPPLSIMFLCYERHWTAVRNSVRGQPGSPVLPLPIHDTILAQRGPRNISPCFWLFCQYNPRLLKMKIFFLIFYLRWPCPQHGSNSRIKEHAKLSQIKQVKAGSLCMHAGFTQESGSLRRNFKREGMDIFFYLTKGPFLTY